MATTDIQTFGSGGSGSPNVLTQSAYVAYLATLTGNSFANGATPSAQQLNKIIRQPSFVAAAIANALVNAGISVPDDGNVGVLAANIAKAFTTGVVGDHRDLAMTVAAASATAILTATELVVESALGGQAFKLASFSQSVNLATTGAGGMDTGTAPVSGFVALYAIYNPTTATSALLAVNATSAAAPEVYGGANMPAGYTMSALVSIWPTNASGQFVIGNQRGRNISITPLTLLNTTSPPITYTSLSLVGSLPYNAKSIFGSLVFSTTDTAASYNGAYIAADSNGTNRQSVAGSQTSPNVQFGSQDNFSLNLINMTIYYLFFFGAGSITTANVQIIATGYSI